MPFQLLGGGGGGGGHMDTILGHITPCTCMVINHHCVDTAAGFQTNYVSTIKFLLQTHVKLQQMWSVTSRLGQLHTLSSLNAFNISNHQLYSSSIKSNKLPFLRKCVCSIFQTSVEEILPLQNVSKVFNQSHSSYDIKLSKQLSKV